MSLVYSSARSPRPTSLEGPALGSTGAGMEGFGGQESTRGLPSSHETRKHEEERKRGDRSLRGLAGPGCTAAWGG